MERRDKAGFMLRALAYLGDLLLLFGATFATSLALVIAYSSFSGANAAEVVHRSHMQAAVHLVYLIYYFSYFTLSHWYAGASFGKKVFGLQVVTTEGNELTFKNSLGRAFAYFLSSHFTLGLGFLLPLLRNDGRSLHDLVASTCVVSRRKAQVTQLVDQSKAA